MEKNRFKYTEIDTTKLASHECAWELEVRASRQRNLRTSWNSCNDERQAGCLEVEHTHDLDDVYDDHDPVSEVGVRARSKPIRPARKTT